MVITLALVFHNHSLDIFRSIWKQHNFWLAKPNQKLQYLWEKHK